MKITDVIINSTKTVGTHLLLTEVTPYYEYESGKRTEKIKGYKYVVAMPDRGFDKLTIKIEGQRQDDIVIDGECVEVAFDNLELYIYWMNGTYDVGARATGIHRIKK